MLLHTCLAPAKSGVGIRNPANIKAHRHAPCVFFNVRYSYTRDLSVMGGWARQPQGWPVSFCVR
ncbi:ash family protein [Aeromonas hydrophila]|uniref:ash family protein n=1 Tax=Aeromonas hydrophila TaxID=644 RepID=UPI003977AF89